MTKSVERPLQQTFEANKINIDTPFTEIKQKEKLAAKTLLNLSNVQEKTSMMTISNHGERRL